MSQKRDIFRFFLLLNHGIISYHYRYDDMYHLHMSFTDGQTKETRSASFSRSVATFYDENGVLVYDIFEPEVRKLHSGLTLEKKDK